MDVMQPHLADHERDVDEAWRAHGPAAIRFATAMVGPHDAPDITTTAFMRVVRQPGWTKIEHLDRYLLRAVRNEAQNLYRQRKRRWQRDLAATGQSASEDATSDIDLLRAVGSLSVRQRSIVFLAYWEDLTEADIANVLGLTRSSVHRTLERARSAIRKDLK